MKVLHVVPSYYPAIRFGGPIISLYNLCGEIARHSDVELKVVTTNTSGQRYKDRLLIKELPVVNELGYEVYYYPKNYGKDISTRLISNLTGLLHWSDIVHLTGVYSYITASVLFLSKRLNKPVVWSPRGGLQRWHGTKKRLLKWLWESACNILCDKERIFLHYTSDKEHEESIGRIPRTDSVVIPNGVLIEEPLIGKKWMKDGVLNILYLGRLDRKKGLENLFTAVSEIDFNVHLKICGAGTKNYEKELRRLVEQLEVKKNIEFVGEIEPSARSKYFFDSDICVLPSYTENYGMVVAESLAHGVPVIASKGTPWNRINEIGCGVWIDNDAQSLKTAMRMLVVSDLSKMGEAGRKWMEKEYSWENVGSEMIDLYKKILKM